jgi:WD40 repeat protein
MQVWDVDRGELVTSFEGHGGDSLFGRFATDGSSVYSTGVDGVVRQWDARTGRELKSLSAVGHGPVDVVDDGRILVSSFWQGHAAVVDFRPRGEIGAVETCQGGVPRNALGVAEGTAAFLVHCAGDPDGTTYVASLAEREIAYTLTGHQAEALAISPDGTRFVRQDGEGTLHGPLTVRDLHTGELLVQLDGLCTWDDALSEEEDQAGCREYPDQPFGVWADVVRWSPDGSMITAAVDREMAVWDASSGRLLFAEPVRPEGSVIDAIFTPDSRHLVVSGVGSGSGPRDGLRVFSTQDWAQVGQIIELEGVDDTRYPSLLGYSPDGSILLGVGGLRFIGAAGVLVWIDAETYEVVQTKAQIHDGHTVAAALSPDRTRIATGSSDGFVRVWDADTGQLLHEVPFDGVAVHGVAFVDDSHLAVTPADGNLLIVTTDPDELLDLVRSSLTRGFLATECERFNFGDDCPTLADLRGDHLG